MREQATNRPSRKLEWAVWGGLIVIVVGILGAFAFTQFKGKPLPVYSALSDFTLTNQDGQTVTLADLRGQIWIADVIFTRCPGQCLLMSQHMKELLARLPSTQPIQLVSFTTDPAYDRPAILKKYAAIFETNDARWSFLTGDKSTLHRVEVEDLKLAVVDKPAGQQDSPNDLFIHSEKFVLLDKLGRVRGYFDGGEAGVVAEVLAAANTVAHETLTLHDLPVVNATLNGLCAILLTFGYIFIRRKNVHAHRFCMVSAFITSVIFLICYLTYHIFIHHVTRFHNPAWFRPIYLTILLTHTILAIVIVPLILISLSRALKARFALHKQIARWTWPLWMYVSVTGVIVYLILYQIFPQ
ncbi:MAG TPA: DUF420 domain-containing protein [Candidatus Saccharimonadales bacterium]|nr:DUF420 domain-containing protein [Candidatus Saccharimonadales bacterium]